MSILSKSDLMKRIIIGEMLINPEAETTATQILFDKGTVEDREESFSAYFQSQLSDYSSADRRKQTIKDYIEKNFESKNNSQIIEAVKKDLKNMREFEELEDKLVAPIFIDVVEPKKCLQQANYDLLLGNEVYVTTEKVPKKLNSMGKDGVVSITPGEFGILMTREYIFVPPDLMGFISIRLTHKQKGLVNISGFHVDPGFHGRLMFAVFNAGPNSVPLRYNDPVFMIMFNKLSSEGPIVKKGRWQGMENIPVETLSGLTGTSVSVRSLDQRIKRLEMIFPILATGIASIVIAVITWILTHW